MHVGQVYFNDAVNSLYGLGVSVFVSGCEKNCYGCFNKEAQNPKFGIDLDEEAVINELKKPFYTFLNILGGDPFYPDNQRYVYEFIQDVKDELGDSIKIALWTGSTLDELCNTESDRFTDYTLEILSLIDYLIDGPFIEELKCESPYFGSSNQRVIDLKATLLNPVEFNAVNATYKKEERKV